MARDVVDVNRYYVLGMTRHAGQPRVSPVHFTHHEYRAFYWVSSPDSQHSHNLAADPRVNAVVFDSVPSPQTRAVYLTGRAAEVPRRTCRSRSAEAARGHRRRPRVQPRRSVRRGRPEALPARRRHGRGARLRRPPRLGMGIDTRLPVTL